MNAIEFPENQKKPTFRLEKWVNFYIIAYLFSC